MRSTQRRRCSQAAAATHGRALRAPDEVVVHVERNAEIEELTKRGITSERAEKLLPSFRGRAEELTDILEWGDKLVRDASGKIRNPAGFYVYLLEAMVLPPPSFETSRVRKLRELSKEKADEERVRSVRLELAYEEYQDETIDAYIASSNAEEFEALVAAKRKFYRQSLKTLPDKTINEIARQAVRKDLKQSGVAQLMTIDDFARNRNPDQLTLVPLFVITYKRFIWYTKTTVALPSTEASNSRVLRQAFAGADRHGPTRDGRVRPGLSPTSSIRRDGRHGTASRETTSRNSRHRRRNSLLYLYRERHRSRASGGHLPRAAQAGLRVSRSLL